MINKIIFNLCIITTVNSIFNVIVKTIYFQPKARDYQLAGVLLPADRWLRPVCVCKVLPNLLRLTSLWTNYRNWSTETPAMSWLNIVRQTIVFVCVCGIVWFLKLNSKVIDNMRDNNYNSWAYSFQYFLCASGFVVQGLLYTSRFFKSWVFSYKTIIQWLNRLQNGTDK